MKLIPIASDMPLIRPKPSIKAFIPSIIRFTHPSAMDTRLLNVPLKMSFIPSHAFLQFPVNTPETKLISPFNFVPRFLIILPIALKTV